MMRKMVSSGVIGVLSVAPLVAAAPAGPGPSSDVQFVRLAEQGNTEAIRELLAREGDARPDVNAAQGDGMTALHWAAFLDDIELAKLLVEAKANVEVETRVDKISPLMLAARNGSAPMIRLLVEAGAWVNRPTETGATPLMAASMTGDVDAVRVLLDAKADVSGREWHHGQTPLMFAAWENRPDVIRLLVERGAHTELSTTVLPLKEVRTDGEGNFVRGRGSEQSGANSAMGGMTALLFAARDGNLEAVQALVEAGADIDRVSGGDASTPIVIAIANGHYTVGKYLLDQGADPNRTNLDGLGPLFATVNMRYAPVSWAPNPPTDQEKVDSLELIRELLEAGAEPNARVQRKLWFSPTSHDRGWVDHSGATPFWRAAMSSDVEVMKVLVAGGADPNLSSAKGITPLMVAAGLGWIGNFSQNAPDSWMEAVRYCLELGNDINAVDDDGFTALHGAASRGDNEMVQFLVDNGARVDIINLEGNSAADMAFGPSRFFIPKPETANLLVELGSPFQNNCRSDQCVDGKFLGGAVAK
jgi:ankyrin repeat protein